MNKLKKSINKLKTKLGLLQMDKFALTPYRDYPEVLKELEQVDLDLNTTKDCLKYELSLAR